MSDPKDRRFYERISISGAEVFYRKRRRLYWFNGYNGPVTLKDITKSGICFELVKLLDRGVPLTINVAVPGEEVLSVKGNIVWASYNNFEKRAYAGIRFNLFGKGRQHNSFRTYERLEHITRQFTKFH